MSLEGAWRALRWPARVAVVILLSVLIFLAGVIAAWLTPLWLP